MQIRVSSRNCRAAVGKAVVALEATLTEDRAKFSEASYKSLYEGAVHNGLDVNAAREKEMREMVERDADFAMAKHPGHDSLRVLKNFIDMLAYHQGDDIVINDEDFFMIKEHLSTSPEPYRTPENGA